MLRNVDIPTAPANVTNVSIGMQFDDLCVDFDLNPLSPGSVLAGTISARVRNADGSCGDLIEENRQAALVPSGDTGSAGESCAYRVLAAGSCSPVQPFDVGSTICVPCSGACREFAGTIQIGLLPLFQTEEVPFVNCDGVVIERVGLECAQTCQDNLQAIVILPTSAATAATAVRGPARPVNAVSTRRGNLARDSGICQQAFLTQTELPSACIMR